MLAPERRRHQGRGTNGHTQQAPTEALSCSKPRERFGADRHQYGERDLKRACHPEMVVPLLIGEDDVKEIANSHVRANGTERPWIDTLGRANIRQ